MASLHKQAGNRPGYKLRFRTTDGRQRVLWLGDISKRNATNIARHVTELVEAAEGRVTPDPDTANWAQELTGRLRQRLAEWGYVGAERRSNNLDELRLCSAFFNAYVESRTDWGVRSKCNYRQAVNHFDKFMGKQRLLTDVTPADVDAWRLWMVTEAKQSATNDKPALGLAVATANKHAKRIKKLFSQAIRSKLLRENPVDSKIGGEVNRDRDHYIDRTTTAKVLKQLAAESNFEWALIFGLCRYAGLRCPTEVMALTWADVDWAANRLRIDSQKTGLRFCPIFPELRPLLEAVFNDAPEGTLHCIRNYRGRETNLRSQLLRILTRTGVHS